MTAVNVVLLIVSVVIVFPTAVLVIEGFSDHCTSSFDRAERAFALWATVIAPITLLAIRLVARGTMRHALVSALIHVSIVAAAAIALPNLDFGSQDRSRQKRTLANMRSITRELDVIHAQSGAYPAVDSVDELQRRTRVRLSATDGWGNPLVLRSSPHGYVLTSHGLCRRMGATVIRGRIDA